MKYPFAIPPFGNWTVADQAMEQVVADASSETQTISLDVSEERVNILQYTTGERKMVFTLPFEHNGEIFNSAFPDPVLLYLSTAHQHFDISERIKNEGFPKVALHVKGSKERMLNSSVNSTNSLYNSYLQSRICAIIMLHSSLEAFVNAQVPDAIIFPWVDKKGTTRSLSKKEIDFQVKFKDKIGKVIPFVSGIDLVNLHRNLLDDILFFYGIRNQFIHLKTYTTDGFKPSYTKVFHQMLSLDLIKYFKVVHAFMNIVKPDYIKQ